MNDKAETAAANEAGSPTKASDSSEDGPSPSTSSVLSNDNVAGGSSFFGRIASLFRQRNGSNLREEIADALAETATDTAESFSPGERAMLNNILRLREVRVENVMVPRADVEAIEIGTTLGDLLAVFEKSGHSRMPVYAETLDDPRGMIHIRDVLAHISRSARVAGGSADAAFDLGQVDLSRTIGELELIRTVLFVPPSMLASDLMTRMQATRTQMALVIDEYGGTDGLVSLEDIVEMVVGDIEDEHDEEETLVTRAPDGSFVVDARAEIEDVARLIGEDFAAGEHGDYVDTIGGMIFNTLGRVPVRGEVVQPIPGFEFHVLDADRRRVRRVRIVNLLRAETEAREARAEEA